MRARPLIVIAILALAALPAAGCGGDSSSSLGGDTDPEEVLSAALGSESEPIRSGVLELGFDLEASGAGAGTLTASLEGPFSSGEDGALPQVDFEASADVDAADTRFDFEGGVTITSEGGYVTYDGTAYELDEQTFALLQQSYRQSAELQESEAEQGSLEAFGVNPANWITDLTNEGTEDLEGTETVHVSGSADVPKLIEDLTSVAEQTGQAAQIDEAELQQVSESVTGATIDLYADVEDGTLRRLEVALDLAGAGGEGASIDFTVGIADPNSDQEISAPEDPRPLAELIGQLPGGAEALGGLGGLGGTTPAPSGDGAAGAEDYYRCAAEATTAADLQDCAELLAP